MKTRSIIMLIAGAIITLSFTLVKVSGPAHKEKATRHVSASEPVGGLAIEDKN
jgi:hypothetical protein